jgi:trans-aconitate methyltransferase
MASDKWDPQRYDQGHAFVHKLAAGLVEILAPKAGDRILDLGCGTGALTRRIADAGAAVVGIDASPAMIEQARLNFPSLEFEVVDALSMQFTEPFDAIFSNAALHWMQPPQTVAARMFAAIKPGGRLVLEMGGKGNVSAILSAAIAAGQSVGIDLTPMIEINYFPGIGEYAGVLERAGFTVTFAALFDRPTRLSDGEAGLRNWIRMFRPNAEAAIPVDRRDPFFDVLEQQCRGRLFCDGTWFADYRRLRMTANRPA